MEFDILVFKINIDEFVNILNYNLDLYAINSYNTVSKHFFFFINI